MSTDWRPELWFAVILLGAYHGLNPGMGWPLAVANGMWAKRDKALFATLFPLAGGHFFAMAAALLPFSLLLSYLDWSQSIRFAAGGLVAAFGAFKLANRRHTRVLARLGPNHLALWSFLAATAQRRRPHAGPGVSRPLRRRVPLRTFDRSGPSGDVRTDAFWDRHFGCGLGGSYDCDGARWRRDGVDRLPLGRAKSSAPSHRHRRRQLHVVDDALRLPRWPSSQAQSIDKTVTGAAALRRDAKFETGNWRTA